MKNDNLFLKVWRIIYPLGIHFGVSIILSIGALFLIAFQINFESIKNGTTLKMEQVAIEMAERVTGQTLLITLITSMIVIPIMLLFYKRDKKRQFYLEERPAKFYLIDYIVIALLAMASCLALNNLISVSDITKYSKTYQQVSEALFNSNVLFVIIVVGIFAPIVEELVFRGLIYKRLKEYKTPLFAMILSSFLFGLYHMNIVQGIYAFLLGLILSYLMEKYKSVKAPALAHIAANICSVVLTEWSLLERLEKSLIVFWSATVVSIIVCIGLLIWFKKREVQIIG